MSITAKRLNVKFENNGVSKEESYPLDTEPSIPSLPIVQSDGTTLYVKLYKRGVAGPTGSKGYPKSLTYTYNNVEYSACNRCYDLCNSDYSEFTPCTQCDSNVCNRCNSSCQTCNDCNSTCNNTCQSCNTCYSCISCQSTCNVTCQSCNNKCNGCNQCHGTCYVCNSCNICLTYQD